MNEKIEILMKQSYIEYGQDTCIFSPEKFAELIIRECAKTAENSFVFWPMDGSLQRNGCARTILGHFGVEE